MIETALAQLRFAYSMVSGQPFAEWSLEALVRALRATRREFGAVGQAGAELVSSPILAHEARREMQRRRFQQAARAAQSSQYYGELFTRLALHPGSIAPEQMPVTTKDVVRDQPDAFVRRGAQAYLRATTTGTTGRPTSICFSLREMRVYAALQAIDALCQGDLDDSTILQVSTAARGLLGNLCTVMACAHVGALVISTGLVDPAYTLALLAEERHIPGKEARVSHLQTYPSYLGELIETGRRLGYRAQQFGLREISLGGEVVTAAVMKRARQIFGEVRFVQPYGMTETWPLNGALCEENHLHFEPAHGLVEVLDPITGQAAGPGEAGTIVATPFPPFRETTMLLRYDTQDLTRCLATTPACSLRHKPATGQLLGKLRHAVRTDAQTGWTFPRDILEAVESVDAVPLPARCGWRAAPGGVAVEVVARRQSCDVRRAIGEALEARGVPLRQLTVLDDPARLQSPFPWRSDQRELTLDLRPACR